MYLVAIEYTNEHVDIHGAICVDRIFKTKDKAVAYANKQYHSFVTHATGWPDRSYVKLVDTNSFLDICSCQICPYPKYVVGEALDDGEYYHMYYMVFEIEE